MRMGKAFFTCDGSTNNVYTIQPIEPKGWVIMRDQTVAWHGIVFSSMKMALMQLEQTRRTYENFALHGVKNVVWRELQHSVFPCSPPAGVEIQMLKYLPDDPNEPPKPVTHCVTDEYDSLNWVNYHAQRGEEPDVQERTVVASQPLEESN